EPGRGNDPALWRAVAGIRGPRAVAWLEPAQRAAAAHHQMRAPVSAGRAGARRCPVHDRPAVSARAGGGVSGGAASARLRLAAGPVAAAADPMRAREDRADAGGIDRGTRAGRGPPPAFSHAAN